MTNIIKPIFPKHFPLGTPKEKILEAMENAKEGDKFTMDFAITSKGWGVPSDAEAEADAKADAERIKKKLENKNRW